jgi:AcrR family transcriptional regulator
MQMETITFDKLRIEEKKNRKLMILNIAEAILHEEGLNEITIRKVAEKAGLSIGAMYLYFKNKEELLLFILIHKLKVLHSEFETCVTIPEPSAAMKAMALVYRNYFLNYGQYIDLFKYATESEEDRYIDPELMSELRDVLAMIFGTIERMAGAEKIQKHLRGIPPSRIVPILWSLVHGISQITLSTPRGKAAKFDFDQIMDDFINLLLPQGAINGKT